MQLNIFRKTISGKEAFEFEANSAEYIVKNFSDSDVLVSFDENAESDKTIKIPSMFGQVCLAPTNAVNTVYVDGNGEVEVQSI